MKTTFEAVVQAIRSDDWGEPGLYVYTSGGRERSRYSKLDLGDAPLSQFHIGQKVRVTVEAVQTPDKTPELPGLPVSRGEYAGGNLAKFGSAWPGAAWRGAAGQGEARRGEGPSGQKGKFHGDGCDSEVRDHSHGQDRTAHAP